MKNNLIKKFLSFSVGGYINLFIGLITVPVITRLFSPEQFGIYSLVFTIINLLTIFCCLGFEQGFVRFFYEVDGNNRGKLLYDSLVWPFFMSVLIILSLTIFKKEISIFIVGKYEKFLILSIVLCVIFSSLRKFSLLIIRMNQRGILYSILNVLIKIFEFIPILLLYKIYGDTYKILIISMLTSLILISILSMLKEKEIWKFKGETVIRRNDLLKYSSPLALTMGLNWMFSSCDKVVIKFFSPAVELGLYSGAFKLISIISVIQGGFTTFWTPVSYEHYLKSPKDTLFFKKTVDYLSLIFFLLGIGMLIFRRFFILILGKSYYMAIYILPMLIFIPVMYLISETTMIGIDFKKKTKYHLYISILISILNLILNILFVPKFGGKGAAISTGVSYILFFILRTFFSQKLINFNFNLKRVYIVIFLMLIYSLILTFYDNVYFDLIGVVLLGVLVYLYKNVIKELYKNFFKSRKLKC